VLSLNNINNKKDGSEKAVGSPQLVVADSTSEDSINLEESYTDGSCKKLERILNVN